MSLVAFLALLGVGVLKLKHMFCVSLVLVGLAFLCRCCIVFIMSFTG